MKRFAIVLTALGLAAGAAQAASFDEPHNSPVRPFTAEQTSQVRADEVLSPRELNQRDIAPDAVIEKERGKLAEYQSAKKLLEEQQAKIAAM